MLGVTSEDVEEEIEQSADALITNKYFLIFSTLFYKSKLRYFVTLDLNQLIILWW